ncbi:MAG: two-component regulator propeller domain-containing protein [Ferruginibacter sp.]
MNLLRAALYLFLLLPAAAAAQYPFYKKIDVEEENLTIKATALLKDHNGFLWAGTSEGLFKFSGQLPQRMGSEKENTNFYITALAEDGNDMIWAGCRNGTIITIKNQQQVLFTPVEGLPKTTITAILDDHNQHIWFATAGEGIFYTDGNHLHHLTTGDGLSDDNINCLYLAGNGEIFAGSDRGISFIRTGKQKPVTGFFTARNGLPDNIIRSITASSKKDIVWVGTQSKGVLQFNTSTRQIVSVPAGWAYGQVNDLLEDNESIFIATEQNGLVCYNKERGLFKKNIFKDSASMKRITDIQADNEENIWLASDSKLISFTGSWLTYWMGTPQVSFAKIHTLLADENNTLWFTPDFRLFEGLQLMQANGTKLNSYDITPPEDLIDITCLYRDTQGFLWIGTMGKGVFRMNTVTGERRSVKENAVTDNGHILSIAGKGNEVWISTLNGVARFYLAAANYDLKEKLGYTNYSKRDGLGSDYIYHIMVDSKDRVWFATDGAGVTVYEHNVFLNYYHGKMFPSKVAYSLAEDRNHHIWVSTYSDGLFEFDEKKFNRFGLKNGLTDLAITSVAVDRQNNIIAVNKKGIDILNPQKGIVQHIGAESGFSEQQPNLNSITTDRLGNVWIGTENGIVRLASPASFGTTTLKAVIETVQLFGNQLEPEHGIYFSHTENSFTFKIAAAYYKAPEKVRFQYWLEGYSEKWETTSDRLLSFSQLNPGNYTFNVKASANENFENAPVATYHFIIRHSFWTTWWFRILLFLAVTGLTYWFVKERIKSVRKKENALREKFQLQYDALKHQVNPHFLFNSFNALLNIVEDNPKEAAALIKHLSSFYRKMTSHSQKELILVQEELELLQSYLYIQQKRFGSALQFTETLEPWIKKSTFIPPLVLQLLAENAVKHNTISREKPLVISLYTEDEFLVMKNNINHKLEKEAGEGVGLQNIENRYKLLTETAIIQKSTATEFIIMVPLIYLN